ncbi:hypothetical protein Nisw_08900 [Candidatus Nitrosopumilus sp. SW]|uniref:hypothetical protein n=1 Tax=Candidatus Nitrosopumilus sp. SW TaxID=2508726 RepID=UPI0011507B7F|nr:hypothetical protein [Candidatus Nitrosopumilus sp. SW]QDI89631.1 hypothetical protein Nisw_08900 [Candidatus Nitrosopumilus sp. SW]
MNSKSKQEILLDLENLEKTTKKLNSSLKSQPTNISKKETRNEVEKFVRTWYEGIKIDLVTLKIEQSLITELELIFDKLLKLSSSVSRKTSYLECMDNIIPKLRKLKFEITKNPFQNTELLDLESLTEHATNDEIEYLTEAVNCANQGYFRASVVLGWSAAIARIHKVIEKNGFDEFNRKSVEMKGKTKGRYKRFSKSFDIGSLSELQTVFDTDILWIVEYWGLIDTNEHDRLEICFTMRNNAAHPGEAPITEPNLLSFYSDLKIMVFDNSDFKIV